jgi:demethylmenaquinone methyltransferase/2-methoxy-6-polyprenyl-1,4-benzoquinol methylase
MRPETRYTKNGDVHIAYQVVGDGPIDLVLVHGWISHIEHQWEDPSLARFLERLASFSRLITFDKRGPDARRTGVSTESAVDDMVNYYAKRAREYDRVYDFPPWQSDLRQLKERAMGFFAGRRVFEVACGTGYWTHCFAQSATEVYAIDANETTLAIARSRDYGGANVRFEQGDAYAACNGAPRFDGGHAGGWLSHVDLARMETFLKAFHSYLVAGAIVLMVDERETAGRNHHMPASRTDARGNRYELRQLGHGDRFEIIKNFYTEDFFLQRFAPYASDLAYTELEHFWTLAYTVRG